MSIFNLTSEEKQRVFGNPNFPFYHPEFPRTGEVGTVDVGKALSIYYKSKDSIFGSECDREPALEKALNIGGQLLRLERTQRGFNRYNAGVAMGLDPLYLLMVEEGVIPFKDVLEDISERYTNLPLKNEK